MERIFYVSEGKGPLEPNVQQSDVDSRRATYIMRLTRPPRLEGTLSTQSDASDALSRQLNIDHKLENRFEV